MSLAYLVDEGSDHVALGPLERPERTSKVEANLVLLSLHADPEQDPTRLLLEVIPHLVRQEVSIPTRVETDVRAADLVVLADKSSVADGRHEPKILLDRDVEGLVPSRVERLVDRPGLGESVAVLITEGDERVELAGRVAVRCDEAFCEDDLDGEQEALGGFLSRDRRCRVFDDLRNLVDAHLLVHPVELVPGGLDIVEFDTRRGDEVERLDLLLPLQRQLGLDDPRVLLRHRRIDRFAREHLGQEHLLDRVAVLVEHLAQRLRNGRGESQIGSTSDREMR